jgi:hypothetical protein
MSYYFGEVLDRDEFKTSPSDLNNLQRLCQALRWEWRVPSGPGSPLARMRHGETIAEDAPGRGKGRVEKRKNESVGLLLISSSYSVTGLPCFA